MQTFEQILGICNSLRSPGEQNSRQITWLDPEQVLGLARQPSGGLEIFICGERLYAGSLIVRRHLEHNEWERVDAIAFPANRIVLPAAQHYMAVAAFLAEELLRRGVLVNRERAFHDTEPIIEMALRRLTLTEEQILGLLGELRFIEALLAASATEEHKVAIIKGWLGSERSSRDFRLGPRSIEVKSTTADASSHHVSNIRQVDPDRDASDVPIEQLFLVSFGFQRTIDVEADTSAISLSEQVERILARLSGDGEGRTSIAGTFLDKLAQYGSGAHHGYIHDEMKEWSAYQDSWGQRFVRIYDMSDERVRVLRASIVAPCVHVALDSVAYEVTLPDYVDGDLNPTRDILAFAADCL